MQIFIFYMYPRENKHFFVLYAALHHDDSNGYGKFLSTYNYQPSSSLNSKLAMDMCDSDITV